MKQQRALRRQTGYAKHVPVNSTARETLQRAIRHAHQERLNQRHAQTRPTEFAQHALKIHIALEITLNRLARRHARQELTKPPHAPTKQTEIAAHVQQNRIAQEEHQCKAVDVNSECARKHLAHQRQMLNADRVLFWFVNHSQSQILH